MEKEEIKTTPTAISDLYIKVNGSANFCMLIVFIACLLFTIGFICLGIKTTQVRSEIFNLLHEHELTIREIVAEQNAAIKDMHDNISKVKDLEALHVFVEQNKEQFDSQLKNLNEIRKWLIIEEKKYIEYLKKKRKEEKNEQ